MAQNSASVAPRGHGHLGLGTRADAVEVRHLAGNGLAQGLDASHRRILVVAVGQVVAHPLEKLRRTVEVGIALRQVDRALVGRELRHDREDRRADVRQLAFERHSHGSEAVAEGAILPQRILGRAHRGSRSALSGGSDRAEPTLAGETPASVPSVRCGTGGPAYHHDFPSLPCRADLCYVALAGNVVTATRRPWSHFTSGRRAK